MAAPKEIMAKLAARGIPGSEATWLDVAADAARDALLRVEELFRGGRLADEVIAARRSAFATLLAAGYSTTEIAVEWGVSPWTVSQGRKRGAIARPVPEPVRELDRNIGPSGVDEYLAWIAPQTERVMAARAAMVRATLSTKTRAA